MSGDPKGYHTGIKNMETAIYEFESAKDMEEFMCDGSVESGESMGDYVFNVVAMSHSNYTFNQIVEHEQKEEEKRLRNEI